MEDIHELFPSKKRNREHRLEMDIQDYALNDLLNGINNLNINNNNHLLTRITEIIENNIKINHIDKIYKKMEQFNDIDKIYVKLNCIEKKIDKISVDKDYDISELKEQLESLRFEIKEYKYNYELKRNVINDYFS